jgi:uncharacterized protein YcaQ
MISVEAVRRHVIAAQGYAGRRLSSNADDVETTIRSLGAVQLDSISTVDRSHRLTLGARIGTYPKEAVSKLLGEGRLFEYWAHEACLMTTDRWPMWKRRMDEYQVHPWHGEVVAKNPDLAGQVLAEIRERGPLGSRHFEGAGSGGMWNWKPAKVMLEALWSSGELAIAGRQGFQRLYDLSERVIPAEYLAAPIPTETEFLREVTVWAVTSRGALTERGVCEHARLKGGVARLRPHSEALVREGLLDRHEVDDGGAPVLVPAGTSFDANPTATVLISPFDNLLWDRPFARRVIGFDHLIEVYKPAPQRQYGYYVLPLVAGDRVIGRADLKADRKAGQLRVVAYHPEPGFRSSQPLERALDRLARTLGLAAG